ncbi:MAG: uroporphyrinogen-III synthase [Pseudomonadota bacterium]
MTVLLTRPEEDSVRIAAQLTKAGIDSLIWPLMQIRSVGDGIEIPDGTQALLVTSAHAVRCAAEAGVSRDLPVFCVGTRTAEICRDAGFATVHDAAGTAADLVQVVETSGLTRFFYLRGHQVSTDLVATFAETNIQLNEKIVYRADPATQIAPDAADALLAGRIAAVTVWSARQAVILGNFAGLNPGWRLESTDLVAISDRAAGVLEKTGFRRILVASRPDADAMVSLISAAVRQKAD